MLFELLMTYVGPATRWERPAKRSRTGSGRPNADDRIPYAAYVGLIERAAVLLGDPGYGLKLGASHGVRDNGCSDSSP